MTALRSRPPLVSPRGDLNAQQRPGTRIAAVQQDAQARYPEFYRERIGQHSAPIGLGAGRLRAGV